MMHGTMSLKYSASTRTKQQ